MKFAFMAAIIFLMVGCAESRDSKSTEVPFVPEALPTPIPESIPEQPRGSKTAPLSKSEFCEQRKQNDYFIRLSYEPLNQLAFRNEGGLKDKGVCWWHALFQRSAIYTAVYRPDLPKPNLATVKKIVHRIAVGSKIVEVPGYKNLNEFSRDWQTVIQSKLESWQKIDGFLKFAWIKGLVGSTHADPQKIKSQWDEFEKWIEVDKKIEWAMLQLKGISTHGVLLIGVDPSSTYNINYLDSNFIGAVSTFRYNVGENTVNSMYGPFVPYAGRRSDHIKFKYAADHYCYSKSGDMSLEEYEDDEPLSNELEEFDFVEKHL